MYPNNTTQDIPYGYCQCGCGQLAPIATGTHTKYGWVKGQPKRFVKGHWLRTQWAESSEERFWKYVDRRGLDDCWEWQASRDQDGYGRFYCDGKNIPAHRFSYELHHGPIADAMLVCHECDNHPCCNPRHLFEGSPASNSEDMKIKGRAAKGEQHGMTKLTCLGILEIRGRYESGETQTALAKEFGVNQTTISCIVLKKTWAHV